MNVYPAVLTESIVDLSDQIKIAQDTQEVETIHIDVIDGFFADAFTITPIDLNEVDLGELKVDFHLMATEPLDFVYEAISSLPASTIRAMIGQVEQMSWQSEFMSEVKKHGWKAGLALNLYTPVDEIAEESWAEVDIILLMAVEAGTQGKQPFNPVVLEKLAEVRSKLEKVDRKVEVIIDGGVKMIHLSELSDAGADGVAVGSDIWTAADPENQIRELLRAA